MGTKAMRRKVGGVSALLALMGTTLVLLAGPAEAQAYPPATCNVTLSNQQLGSFNVGTTIRFSLAPPCIFQPGVPVALTVNGVPIPGKFAEANGFVTVQVEILSSTTLSVDDPVFTPAICGTNTAQATGFSRVANSNVTQTAFFNVVCPPAFAPPAQPGRVAFTGANIVRWSMVALAAMLAGVMLVITTKRRSRETTVPDDARELTRS